jgi:ATP adenylyltransferase
MTDGALKSANVESDTSLGEGSERPALGLGGKFAVGVMGLSAWMLLMTAIYFHTWFEKVSKARVVSHFVIANDS